MVKILTKKKIMLKKEKSLNIYFYFLYFKPPVIFTHKKWYN